MVGRPAGAVPQIHDSDSSLVGSSRSGLPYARCDHAQLSPTPPRPYATKLNGLEVRESGAEPLPRARVWVVRAPGWRPIDIGERSPPLVASMLFARHLLTLRLGREPVALVLVYGPGSPLRPPGGMPAPRPLLGGPPRLVHSAGPSLPACALATARPSDSVAPPRGASDLLSRAPRQSASPPQGRDSGAHQGFPSTRLRWWRGRPSNLLAQPPSGLTPGMTSDLGVPELHALRALESRRKAGVWGATLVHRIRGIAPCPDPSLRARLSSRVARCRPRSVRLKRPFRVGE
jgi:hypothetical protein